MKKLFFIICLITTAPGWAQSCLTTAVQGFQLPVYDIVQPVRFAVADTLWKAGLWDFSELLPEGEPIISYTKDTLHETILCEGETKFRFDNKTDGNYYKGWEDSGKKITLHEAYNKLPLPFAAGMQHSATYTATGLFSPSGVVTAINGTYTVEADAEGKIILPDGRMICPAIRLKTTDRYNETNCNTTAVTIEKYLWYIPYYIFPVFVSVQTTYEYTGGIRDTIQAAYYTLNDMPLPAPVNINDTTICAGQEIWLTSNGTTGKHFLRNLNENTDFTPFTDTLLKPLVTTAYALMATYDLCVAETILDTITITVKTPPVLLSHTNDTTIYQGCTLNLQATSEAPLQWYSLDTDGQHIAVNESQVQPENDTRYIAVAFNSPCTNDTAMISVTVLPQPQSNDPVIWPDEKKEKEDNSIAFIIYPNPAQDFITVIVPADILYYRIIGILGTIVDESKRPGNETMIQIPIRQLSQGEYFLHLQTRDTWLTKIFIKTE